jgi:hypothetical protein
MTIKDNSDNGGARAPLLTEQQAAYISFGNSLYSLRQARKDGPGPPWVKIGRAISTRPRASPRTSERRLSTTTRTPPPNSPSVVAGR